MLLAEELALVAIRPDSGRHQAGRLEPLKAGLAGLLVAELVIDGVVQLGDRDDHIAVVQGWPAPGTATLAAAAGVVEEKGPKTKAVISHMSRGLRQRVGMATWDAVVAGLIEAGTLGPATGRLLPRLPLLDAPARDTLLARLRAAAAGTGPIEVRTALVLSMTGPTYLLEVVAPDRATRKHARNRIDHALDGSHLEPFARVVRRLIKDAAAAAAA